MNRLRHILRIKWQNLLRSLSLESTAIEPSFQLITQAYSSPERQYHNLEHIYQVLTTIHRLQIYTHNLAAVKLAAWFHDVVYDTRAKDNEECSAEYARTLLSEIGVSGNTIDMVTRLILNTKHDRAYVEDIDTQVLLDADLAILGTTPEKYQQYAREIRQEYSWVAQKDYIIGRQRVLEEFCCRQQIYLTPLMLRECEDSARMNIKTELDSYQLSVDSC